MRIRVSLASLLMAHALGACASAPKTSASDESSAGRWVGSLQPTQQRTGELAVTGQNRVFGTVSLTPAEGARYERMRARLSVALPTASSTTLKWAVLPQRCGSGDLPMLGFEQFPILEIGNNGRGLVESDIPLRLEEYNAYHVNVYSGGQQLDNVITCANLRLERGQTR